MVYLKEPLNGGHLFTKGPDTVRHNSLIGLKSNFHTLSEYSTITPPWHAVNHVPEKYATNIKFSEVDTHIIHFIQASKPSCTEFDEAKWHQRLQCYTVDDEYYLEHFYRGTTVIHVQHNLLLLEFQGQCYVLQFRSLCHVIDKISTHFTWKRRFL